MRKALDVLLFVVFVVICMAYVLPGYIAMRLKRRIR